MNNSTNGSAACVNIEASAISDFLMSLYILAFIFGLAFHVLTLGPIFQQVSKYGGRVTNIIFAISLFQNSRFVTPLDCYPDA